LTENSRESMETAREGMGCRERCPLLVGGGVWGGLYPEKLF